VSIQKLFNFISNTNNLTINIYKKIFLLFCISISLSAASDIEVSPYASKNANFIYNLLFCDNLNLFKPKHDKDLAYWEKAFFIQPNADEIKSIAINPSTENRVRALAYNWLRDSGQPSTDDILLGVIIEVPLRLGLDTLASYGDGSIRYINQSEKIVFIEQSGNVKIEKLEKELVNLSAKYLKNNNIKIAQRRPIPKHGEIRITFLTSQGLRIVDGPMVSLQAQPDTGQIIGKAIEILTVIVDMAKEKK
jgi:hypothetical protein